MEEKKERALLVTVYKIDCFASPDPLEIGESCSLLPWGCDREGRSGRDDGGRDYVLPSGYQTGRLEQGEPAIFNSTGIHCELQTHNGCPLLIDAEKRRAYLLEPVRRLQSCRELQGMTRKELAELLHVSQIELYEWESMEKKPETEMLEKIASVLNCKIADLI